jgi:ATP-dependent DNA helicase RecG
MVSFCTIKRYNKQKGVDYMDIENLIGEVTTYDKKQAVEKRKVKSWLKSVSAFANTLGGILIFGIDDEDQVIGLENVKKDSEFISQKIKERIDPIPQTNMHIKQINDKNILLLEVFKGEETPYYYAGDNVMEAYLRIDNESVVANATELKRLVLRGKNSSFDSLSSVYRFDDFAFSKLKERFKQWTQKSFEDKMFYSFHIVDANGYLTNAGAIIADESPIYQNRLFCTRWNGLTKAGGIIDAFDSDEYHGSIISLLRDGEDFIKRNTKTMWKKSPFSRIEMPEYVYQSTSEALVNALIHRDYMTIGSEVHVDIFDDRMEIYSPGGMLNGSSIQDLDIRYIASKRRNPVLADIFNRLGFMERQGSGLSKIIHEYEHQKNFKEEKRPVFYSDRTQFRVILPNLNYQDMIQYEEYHYPDIDTKIHEHDFGIKFDTNCDTNDTNQHLTQNEYHILKLIIENPHITQKQLADITCLSIATVKRNTKALADKGYIKRIGSTKGYWLILES